MRPLAWMLTIATFILLMPAVRAAGAPAPVPSPTATTPAEAKLGAKVAEDIEKQVKLVDDPVALAKLRGIVDTIAPLSERPDVTYTIKILDSAEVNAMAIPGGTIYVTKGLLLAAESDHELAAVLAHEIAHNALYHSRKMMEKSTKNSMKMLATWIAAVYLGGRDSDVPVGGMITMSNLVVQALQNGYEQELETEADLHAVDYLYKSKVYDPVGLYSVMLGFRQMQASHPAVDPGYLKTHPDPDDRRVTLEKRLKELGISINLWRVVNFHADVLPPREGQHDYAVKLGSTSIVDFMVADGDQTPEQRAQEVASAINRRLQRDYIQQYDVDLDLYKGNAYVRMRAVPVITLTQADADAAGTGLEALGNQVVQSIKGTIWQENAKRAFALP